MSTRDIQAHVRELYGLDISPDLVSAVMDEVAVWQTRPLEAAYAIVFFDALRVKIRDEGLVRNKAVYLAIGVHTSGHKEVLGIWIEQTEGARFWLRVMNDPGTCPKNPCGDFCRVRASLLAPRSWPYRPGRGWSTARRQRRGR